MSPSHLPNRVVVPTYNEADNLEPLLEAVLAAAPEGTGILVVDDSSPDGTGEIADRLAAADERIAVLHRAGKEGLGPAYVAGFGRALELGAERIVQMDADFSHDPADVPRLIAAAQGRRRRPRARLPLRRRRRHRRLGRRPAGDLALGEHLRPAWLGISVRDLTGGFKCFRREVLEAIRLGTRQRARLRLPGRDDLPRLPGRLPGRRDPDRLQGPPGRRVEDEPLDRRRGGPRGAR